MTNLKQSPIGVFDSGMGGITVLSTLIKELPNESFIYFGDSLNAPYGTKDIDTVRKLTIRACDYLISIGVKAIVIACNTATSAAIKDLRKRYSIPIIGVEPALKPAVEYSNSGTIAVMATPMTLKEKKFEKLMERYMDRCSIIKVPCPQLVQLVEAGHTDDDEIIEAIEACFKDIEKNSLDSIVLGCTHYVFLHTVLKKVFPDDVMLVDGNLGTARQTQRLLQNADLLNNGTLNESDRIRMMNSKSEELVKQSWRLLNSLIE